jgi:signal transduction histidine kinase
MDGATRRKLEIVGIAGLAVIAAGVLLPFNSPLPPATVVTPTTQAVLGLVSLLWLTTALLALSREPSGPLWKLLFAWLTASWIWVVGYVPTSLTWTIGVTFASLGTAVLVHVLVAFPSGHLRTRFDRAFVAFVYGWTIGVSLLSQMTWDVHFTCPSFCPTNIFLVWPNDSFRELWGHVTSLGVPLIGAVVIYAVWRHWRTAGPSGRRALMPAIVALPFAFVINVAGYLADNFDVRWLSDLVRQPAALALEAIVPIGLLIGIARNRLGRTRIADLVVELGRGVPTGGLRDVLARALGDPTLQLVFPAPNGDGFVDPDGKPVALPSEGPMRAVTRLDRDGELLAVLVHDPAIDAEDPSLIDAVGSAARLALDNERLAAEVRAQLDEVRASRVRIIEAADAERLRVERDLHDGAQQRLVALAMRLELARHTAAGASSLLDEATAELRTAIGEVRDLARGIHPTILTHSGLQAAVEALAERATSAVVVDIPDRRFSAPIEATAYFVIAEALTNVARHARATSATVTVTDHGGRLQVTIRDDGRGGADATGGSGLRGLADRVAAIGGTLAIESPPGGGTSIHAELPLE